MILAVQRQRLKRSVWFTDVETAFSHKLRLPRGRTCVPASGYEIHHGRITRGDTAEEFPAARATDRCSAPCGTACCDALREAFPARDAPASPRVNYASGRTRAPPSTCSAICRTTLDVDALLTLAPPWLPADLARPGAP